MSGHSVLLVPVVQLEPWVRARTAHHDPAYVSDDPAFTHAHVTALAPFLPEPDEEALAQVAAIARSTEPFDFRLERLATFPDGTLHLVPEPPEPFALLTARLAAAFPQCPPYDGAFDTAPGGVVPHLTLDRCSDTVTPETNRASLGGVLPATCRAERLELTWWEAGGCRVLRSWGWGV